MINTKTIHLFLPIDLIPTNRSLELLKSLKNKFDIINLSDVIRENQISEKDHWQRIMNNISDGKMIDIKDIALGILETIKKKNGSNIIIVGFPRDF